MRISDFRDEGKTCYFRNFWFSQLTSKHKPVRGSMCKRKKRYYGNKNDKNYRNHLSRALRAELIFAFIDLTEASGSFLVAWRSNESSSSSDLNKQKSFIGFEYFIWKEINYMQCIIDQWLLVTVNSWLFFGNWLQYLRHASTSLKAVLPLPLSDAYCATYKKIAL